MALVLFYLKRSKVLYREIRVAVEYASAILAVYKFDSLSVAGGWIL
jgi:hypothetical protein